MARNAEALVSALEAFVPLFHESNSALFAVARELGERDEIACYLGASLRLCDMIDREIAPHGPDEPEADGEALVIDLMERISRRETVS